MPALVRMTDEAFRAAPIGGWVAGTSWLYFCVDLSLFGFVLWEVPSEDDMTALVTLMERELDRPPHAAFVDVRRLRVALGPSFARLATYFAEHAEALARVVTHGAIVRGEGVTGAVAAGFLDTVPPTFRATVWSEPEAALASLGVRDPSAVAEAIDAAYEDAAGSPRALEALRAWLEKNLDESTLEIAARSLAMSARTLQRRLGEAGTSFVDELGKARVRVAQRMLLDSDVPISTIALDVGCASPQHFASLFKKHVGETPTDYRRRLARR